MQSYDVIIVGAGPAGLICAEKLIGSGLSILLIEKDTVFGDKVCAGGLTRKDLGIYDFPDEIIARKVYKTAVHSPKRFSHAETPDPIVITMDRKDLGRFQRARLEGSGIEVLKGTRVNEIKEDSIITSDGKKFGYTYLVGADGYASVVRRYLNIPVKRKLIGIQYVAPIQSRDPKLEIFLDSKHFHAWYGWIFPHRDVMSVGCCCDARFFPAARLKENFQRWLDKKRIDVSNAEYQSAPISYDFRGLRFGNIFLVGEAAGMASGLTGEGIFQSLVSGIEVAEYIMGRDEESEQMRYVRKYNLIQLRIMNFLIYCGPLRGIIHEMILLLMNNKRFKEKINKGFS
ncbi:MAG: NAD(P)/FAD-dependent oxidoreductase [Bacteroidales bacterium]|jgi:geranylgeranyl reductase|nr:NAD(P)/FAD-dependent oxidoreductase [Bacteroidales bacterium]